MPSVLVLRRVDSRMCLSCHLVNVHVKLVNVYWTFTWILEILYVGQW